MAYLFSNINDFKAQVGGGANVSLRMESLTPIIELTAQRHIQPWLGTDALNHMVDNFQALNANYTALLPYVQRPLALLTMYEYAKVGGIQFGENGIFRIEAEHQKSAYKYQENQYSRPPA